MTDLEIVTLLRRCIEAIRPQAKRWGDADQRESMLLLADLEMSIKEIEGKK